jgi:drug/metabolite transporter (DMT)-like permease
MLGSVLGLSGALVWGLSQVLTKPGLAEMDLARFALIRVVTGLVCVIPFGLATSEFAFPPLPALGAAVSVGVIDCFLGVLLFMLAVQRIDAHQATPLANAAPLWGVLAAWLFLAESLSVVVLVAALLVVCGAYFLAGRGTGSVSGRRRLWGLAFAVGCGACWGIAETVPAKYCMSQGMSPATFQLIVMVTTTALWSLAAAIGRHRHWTRNGRRAAVLGVVSGFTGFFLGWTLWLSGLQLAPASVLAPLRGTTILFGFIGSVAFLRERPTRRAMLGGALVLAGVLLVLALA